MEEIQKYLIEFQKDMKWEIKDGNYNEARMSILNNYMLLTTEVSEIAEEFRAVFNTTYSSIKNNVDENSAFELAKSEYKENIGKEIVDCIAYLVKFANYFEIDLDKTFYEKMEEIKSRENKDQR